VGSKGGTEGVMTMMMMMTTMMMMMMMMTHNGNSSKIPHTNPQSERRARVLRLLFQFMGKTTCLGVVFEGAVFMAFNRKKEENNRERKECIPSLAIVGAHWASPIMLRSFCFKGSFLSLFLGEM